MANKRLPTKLKIIRGTNQPCRRKKEPAFKKLNSAPSPPEYLSRYGKQIWRKLAPELFKKGLMASVHLPTMEALCEAYALYREAHEAVYTVIDLKTGKKNQRTLSKYLKGKSSSEVMEYRILKAAFQDFRLYLLEFGLSPSAAGNIDLPAPVKEESIIANMWDKRHE